MKKLAIFVEGQTEQIFVKYFIEQIAGVKDIEFDCKVMNGGAFISLNQKSSGLVDPSYFVLLVDCRNDERVKSTVLDQREALSKKGYSLILGLRDMYPSPYCDLAKVKGYLKYGVPTSGVPTHILLAVAEIESWFIQESFHFQKIHSDLDPLTFKSSFGFDPVTECAEYIEHPAELLNKIYGSVGLAYKKTRKHVERTVKVLDYENLYLCLPSKVPHLSDFVCKVESFLT